MIDKVGSPTKIVEVTDESLKQIRKKIAAKNNLIRCPQCGRLLCKIENSKLDIQHKKLVCVVETKDAVFQCPVCGVISGVKI
jgi:4-hydroxy-3-methylbut-2-en-1-yl diphosphate synthase IspG/GcpE